MPLLGVSAFQVHDPLGQPAHRGPPGGRPGRRSLGETGLGFGRFPGSLRGHRPLGGLLRRRSIRVEGWSLLPRLGEDHRAQNRRSEWHPDRGQAGHRIGYGFGADDPAHPGNVRCPLLDQPPGNPGRGAAFVAGDSGRRCRGRRAGPSLRPLRRRRHHHRRRRPSPAHGGARGVSTGGRCADRGSCESPSRSPRRVGVQGRRNDKVAAQRRNYCRGHRAVGGDRSTGRCRHHRNRGGGTPPRMALSRSMD